MKYNYKLGTYEGCKPSVLDKLALMATGGVIGVTAALCVVYGQVQSSVHPIVTQDSGNVLPIVHALQQNGDLYVVQSASSVDDLQPASGYNIIQRTERPQP